MSKTIYEVKYEYENGLLVKEICEGDLVTIKYSDDNKIEIKLLDDSNITVIIDKERGSWLFKKWLIRLTKREKQNTT